CYAQTRTELIERFGGLTAYSRAPADGLWKPDGGAAVRDELVVVEIMADVLDEAWWKDYRHRLEVRFRQQSILVRALHATLL
ncbi:MAG TPA: hypothetical protein VM406_05145, partial [Noviherbaspirillum sp.]|nr:hypothetical protein [Noviherbaspirillum sp.]